MNRRRVAKAASGIRAAETAKRRQPQARSSAEQSALRAEAEAEVETALLAVTPIDGRYRQRTHPLAAYFSEFALIHYRVRVEIEWYLSLAANPALPAPQQLAPELQELLRAIYTDFSLTDARRVKELEAITNHDVKAVEYFVKERLAETVPELPSEMVHFACTSEDINNLAYALIFKEFVQGQLAPGLAGLVSTLASFARKHKATPMLARTHGQAASPTTVGKEFAVFAARFERQLRLLGRQEYLGKFNGAVGNFNAHRFACPQVDWLAHSQGFVEGLGLVWNPLTTQIESHDFLAELFDAMVRIATILLGFSRDLWGYVSLGYLSQRMVAGEVGSSTMPHKINPIDFENCEGNAGVATSILQHLATKLPVSRFQRDLSDSTAIRSAGTACAHLMVAIDSLKRGLSRVEVNTARIAIDLSEEQAWEVVAEAIQTLMRREGLPQPYETLKQLTRGRAISRETIAEFISRLKLSPAAAELLSGLSPQNYVGLAAELVERFCPAGKG